MSAVTAQTDFTPVAAEPAGEIRLGPIRLSSPAILAPLAGYTNTAMRRICRRCGAGMVFSEMLSAEGARRDNAKTFRMAAFHPEERPYFVQLFATQPEQAADAARLLAELQPDGFDLNFGCPVKKIIANEGGAALLKDLSLLGRIIESTVKAVEVPVSVKMRAGWDRRSLNAVDVARVAEESGAAWVTIHARTRSDFYRSDAQWEWIAQVKAAVRIPVVGNGDVRTARDVIRLMQSTGCDAAMIGRAAMGYPFIFREVKHLLSTGRECEPPTPQERLEAASTQLQWSVEQWGEERAVREFRKHLLAYVRGLPRATLFKVGAMKLERAEDVIHALSDYLLSLPDQPFPRLGSHAG